MGTVNKTPSHEPGISFIIFAGLLLSMVVGLLAFVILNIDRIRP